MFRLAQTCPILPDFAPELYVTGIQLEMAINELVYSLSRKSLTCWTSLTRWTNLTRWTSLTRSTSLTRWTSFTIIKKLKKFKKSMKSKKTIRRRHWRWDSPEGTLQLVSSESHIPKTPLTIFLIFSMKLGINMRNKVTEPDFWKKSPNFFYKQFYTFFRGFLRFAENLTHWCTIFIVEL